MADTSVTDVASRLAARWADQNSAEAAGAEQEPQTAPAASEAPAEPRIEQPRDERPLASEAATAERMKARLNGTEEQAEVPTPSPAPAEPSEPEKPSDSPPQSASARYVEAQQTFAPALQAEAQAIQHEAQRISAAKGQVEALRTSDPGQAALIATDIQRDEQLLNQRAAALQTAVGDMAQLKQAAVQAEGQRLAERHPEIQDAKYVESFVNWASGEFGESKEAILACENPAVLDLALRTYKQSQPRQPKPKQRRSYRKPEFRPAAVEENAARERLKQSGRPRDAAEALSARWAQKREAEG